MSAPATSPAASPAASTPSPPAAAPAGSPAPASPSPPPPTASPSPPPPAVTPTPAPTNSPSPPPPSPVTPSPPGTPPSPPPPPSVKTASPPPPSSKTSSPPPPSSTKTSSPPPPPSNKTSSSSSSSIPSSAIIGIAVAAVLAIAVIAVCVVCLIKRKPKRRRYDDDYGGPKPDSRRPPIDPYYSSEGPPKPHHRPPTPPHLLAHNYHAPVPPPPISDSYDSNSSGGPWRPAPPPPPPHHRPTGSHQNLGPKSSFTYDELEEATNGFTRANLLGEGGFGCVYKGKLPGGQLVAVKQLKAGSGQGEREFQAEVEIISRVHHRHLVSLVGYCIFADQRLLVYDYVSNGTLEHHLHGRDRPVLDWPTRLKIAIGASRGLAYLHEDCHPRIIHRDIKASNILLDEHFEAQVSDFGLAKLANDAHTHITTRVMGTFGYLAPEYASTGKLTDKSDVFSFGVVLLELLTGRRPVDTRQPVGEESLVEWSRPLLSKALEDGSYDDFVDPRLADYDELSMSRMVQAAAACVRHSANKRPKMAQVVRALESDGSSTDLFQGVRPGFSSKQSSPYESTEYDPNQYQADMQRFRKMALESNSLYSGTSEYGLNPSGSSSEGPVSGETRQVERIRRGLLGEESSSSEALPLNNINKPLSGR